MVRANIHNFVLIVGMAILGFLLLKEARRYAARQRPRRGAGPPAREDGLYTTGRYANLLQAPRVQRFVTKVGNIVYASGATTPLSLPQTDYTTRLKIVANGLTITAGGTAPVIAGYGAFGPMNSVVVAVNGARHPYALPAYHADVYSRVRNPGVRQQPRRGPRCDEHGEASGRTPSWSR